MRQDDLVLFIFLFFVSTVATIGPLACGDNAAECPVVGTDCQYDGDDLVSCTSDEQCDQEAGFVCLLDSGENAMDGAEGHCAIGAPAWTGPCSPVSWCNEVDDPRCEPPTHCDLEQCDCVCDVEGGAACDADTPCEDPVRRCLDDPREPSCACVCSTELGAECEGDDDCSGSAVCDMATCECTCSAETGGQCDAETECDDPSMVCNLSSCSCECGATAECMEDGDCILGESCDLSTCTCSDGPPAVVTWITDASDDFCDSISRLLAAYRDGKVDIVSYGHILTAISDAERASWYNESLLECDTTTERGMVVCPSGVTDFPAGEMAVVSMRLAAEVPLSEAGKSFIYSAVFDSDGATDNDWVYVDPYDWDYFQGTDRWYQLIWDHAASQWSVTVSQVDASQSIAPASSAVRVVVLGDTVSFHIPRSEVPGASAAYRVSAFGHDGAYTEATRGGDVSGADPTAPLTPLE